MRQRHWLRWIIVCLGLIFIVLVSLIGSVWFLIQPPATPVPQQLALTFSNVTVVNPGIDRRTEHSLSIEDGQIHSIKPMRPESLIPEETASFSGTYIVPGLIDMHVHHTNPLEWPLYGALFLMHGVTTVRDLGSQDVSILNLRQQLDDAQFAGPRVYACGPIIDGTPAWPVEWFWSVQTATDVQKAIDQVAGADADCVKVYSGLSDTSLTSIQAAAQQYRLPIVGHVPFAVPFEEAGIADVQHLTGVPVTPNVHTTTASERQAQWEAFQYAWQDLTSERMDTIVQTSVEQGIIHTPTLGMWSQLLRLREYPQVLDDPVFHLVPRWHRELLWKPWDIKNPTTYFNALEAGLPKMKEVVRRLHAAGVRIQAGSDASTSLVVPGFSLHEELRQLVDAGLSPEQAWTAASRAAGQTLGLQKLGTLEEGAPVDFLLFREDPTQDLAALSSLEAVIAQGRLYTAFELDGAFSRQRGHFNSWTYEWVSMRMAEWLL